MAIVYG